MRFALKIHPDSVCAAVTGVEVDVGRSQSRGLVLCYAVIGKVDELNLPPQALPERTDELWRHTCFEAFVRPSGGDAYTEFNFAPSTRWAAYRFSGYREGMSVASEIEMPIIEVDRASECYVLQAALELPGGGAWQVGLSAVIEEVGGRKSYWALAHPPGKADFHHADCFALELAASERS